MGPSDPRFRLHTAEDMRASTFNRSHPGRPWYSDEEVDDDRPEERRQRGHSHASHRAIAHHAADRDPPADADRLHWWLLFPVVLPLATPLYNRDEPRLVGMPFFYWFQLSLAALSTAVMTGVYLATRKR